MRIEVKPKQNQQIKFPCILTKKDSEGEDIIIVTSEGREYYQGFVLKHRRLEFGQSVTYIEKNLWMPFEGEIVLSNK